MMSRPVPVSRSAVSLRLLRRRRRTCDQMTWRDQHVARVLRRSLGFVPGARDVVGRALRVPARLGHEEHKIDGKQQGYAQQDRKSVV